MRYVVQMLAIALFVCAHHTGDLTVNVAKPETYVGADAEAARFDFDGAHGEYVALSVSAEISPVAWFAMNARAPVAFVAFDDGTTAFGLGDVELSAKARIFQWRALVVSGGVGTELPTGDPHKHLGGGHVELAPFAAVTMRPTLLPALPVTITALVADHVSLEVQPASVNEPSSGGNNDATPEPAHGSVLGPHTDHEATVRVLASATPLEHVTVGAGAESDLILVDRVRAGPFTVIVQASYAITPHLVAGAGFDAGVGGDVRVPLRLRAGVAYVF